MQKDANGSSHSVITDLASFNYSDSINMQTQNHGFAEIMQSRDLSTVSSYPQMSTIMESFPIPAEKLSAFTPFEAVSYSYEAIPPTGSCHLEEWEATDQVGLKSNGPGSSEMSSSVVNSYSCNNSYKPLQISPLLSGSGFVLAMQEILAEIACYSLENNKQMSYLRTNDDFSDDVDQSFVFQNSIMQERESEKKKKHLLALLQMVDDRYSQCLDEIHTVTSAFHVVTELDPNLHVRFALPTISFMYKSLRDRISSHIIAIGAQLMEGEEVREEKKSFDKCFIEKQWALQHLSKRDNHLWRPQRGLPEKSVSVLKAWMFQNFLHPYPKDAEKHLLALRSGLTRNQVSNWFINARVRLWKPMIEEMYAETNRRKARQNNEETSDGNHRNRMWFENTRFIMD